MSIIYRFTMKNCGPCKTLAKVLEGEDLGVNIEVIDIDENRELCEKFNIRGVPTLADAETGKTLVGLKTISEIKTWIELL